MGGQEQGWERWEELSVGGKWERWEELPVGGIKGWDHRLLLKDLIEAIVDIAVNKRFDG